MEVRDGLASRNPQNPCAHARCHACQHGRSGSRQRCGRTGTAVSAEPYATLNGRPIRQFISTTHRSRDAFLFRGLIQVRPSNGQIGGVALDRNGQALADHAVQLKRGHPARRQLAADTTTDAEGQFSFTGLNPGRYAVEIVADGKVIATSADLTLSARAMVVNGITVSQPDEKTWVGRHPRLLIGIGVGVLFGSMAFIFARDLRNRREALRR